MLDKSGVIRKLLEADALARDEVRVLKSLVSPSSYDYASHVRSYVVHKFLLDTEDYRSAGDGLMDLARQSVTVSARLSRANRELLDVSKHCGATSSAMTKKVMLLLAVQRDFEVDLSGEDTADIETTRQLADIIRSQWERGEGHGAA